MKHLIVILYLLLISNLTLTGQGNAEIKLLSSKKQLVYVEIEGQNAIVYQLARVIDPGVTGFTMRYIDTLVKQPGVNEMVYEGKRTGLSLIGDDIYLKMNNGGLKKSQTVKLNYSDITETGYQEINKAYWFEIFNRLSIEINSRYKWQHYSFRGFQYIDLGSNEGLSFREFKVFADNRINSLRDSLIAVHSLYTSATNEVINNIETIKYDLLKNRLVELGEAPAGSEYFQVIIQSVCKYRPEWFYQLAEDMPAKKNILFESVYGSSMVKKLKAVQTDSPVKKEFIKYKRKDRGFTWKAVASSVAGAALLGFALIALIK